MCSSFSCLRLPNKLSHADWAQQLCNLARCCRSVICETLPASILVILGLAIANLVSAIGDKGESRSSLSSVDYLIVREQLKLMKANSSKLAFLGDSSCLMGVNSQIAAEASQISVSNFCTIGYVGPKGYATMLRYLEGTSMPPKGVVIMLHPIQFQRDPSWESWPHFVGQVLSKQEDSPLPDSRQGLRFLRRAVFERFFLNPLPGHYGVFYGGEATFQSYISTHGGTAVDPSGFSLVPSKSSFENLLARKDYVLSTGKINWKTDDSFLLALKELAKAIKAFGPARVRLIVAPTQETAAELSADREREEAINTILLTLDLPVSQLFKTPKTLPPFYFSSGTHLNYWGQIKFTELLSPMLSEFGAGI